MLFLNKVSILLSGLHFKVRKNWQSCGNFDKMIWNGIITLFLWINGVISKVFFVPHCVWNIPRPVQMVLSFCPDHKGFITKTSIYLMDKPINWSLHTFFNGLKRSESQQCVLGGMFWYQSKPVPSPDVFKYQILIILRTAGAFQRPRAVIPALFGELNEFMQHNSHRCAMHSQILAATL